MPRVKGVDWLLLGAMVLLCALGCLLVWSATSTRDDLTGGDPPRGAAAPAGHRHRRIGDDQVTGVRRGDAVLLGQEGDLID